MPKPPRPERFTLMADDFARLVAGDVLTLSNVTGATTIEILLDDVGLGILGGIVGDAVQAEMDELGITELLYPESGNDLPDSEDKKS